MLKRIVAAALVFVLMSSTAATAQGLRILVTGFGGWSISEGVKGKDFHAGNGETYNQADPTDAANAGFSVGIAEGHGEYGFLYRRQFGQLQVTGPTATTTIGDMATDNYHGYLAYYFGDPDRKVHLYVMVGAGATHFGNVTYTNAAGAQASMLGRSDFSATFGAGVRTMLTDRFGLRFGVQFTPTYVTVSQADTWCDPYWGCYLSGNPQYANQVDISAGVTFRFGK
jgi:outer membrane protein W